ncbi:hypothetical protein HDU98_004419 [Podochytrium sp. JEL0797]|nr:hypothetical protein HDU98_004419 [Podochytrium sp. JEL0797]
MIAEILLLPLAALITVASAQSATNWTKYRYLPDPFVNGPPCPIANNNYAWNTLRNSDGSLYTASKRPIVITTENWDSFFVNSYVAQYLLEILGYRVEVVQTGRGYTIGDDFYAGILDLFLEAWPQDLVNYAQLTQVDRAAVDLGATGYSGIIGLYVPSSLVSGYPELGFDFWRFLLNPHARDMFPASGSSPALIDGKFECNGSVKQCINGTYTPPQCKQPGAQCIELWAYDPGYSPGNFQRIIDSLNLMVTMKFFGFSGNVQMQQALDAGKNVFIYNWAPSVFVASNNITKVLFPATDPEQYVALAGNRDNATVTTDVPTIIIHKLATPKFLEDFPELQSFGNQYQILDFHINEMLKSTVSQNLNFSQAACQWVQQNENVWGPWIPKPPTSVVSCPVGLGRYHAGLVFSCITCPVGFYNWNANNTETCTPCPEGLECPGGSTVLETKGIWMPATNNGSFAPDPYTCPLHSTCCSNATCPANSCSSPEFTGIQCTECSSPGYYMWNSKCTKCSPGGGASFYLIIFGAFLGALALLFLPHEEAPTVEILFFYFQVTYYIFEHQANGLLSLPGISTFLAIAALNVDGMVSDCTLPIQGVSKMMFRFFLPLLIQFYIVVIYFGVRFVQGTGALSRLSHASLEKWTPYYMRGQSMSVICFRATVVVLTFVVMPLVDSSLILLQCNEVVGKYVVRMAPSVECFSSSHAPAAALAIIILFFFLGCVPLFIWFILMRLSAGDNIKYESEGISNIQQVFQCLYIIFKPEMYFMMPVTMVEKGVTSILFTMLTKFDEQTQVNVYIIFLGFLCATRIYWQPYQNHLEAYLNREISLGILIMIAFRLYTDHYGVSTASLVQIGIVVFLPVVLHIIRWTRSNYEKHQHKISGVINSSRLAVSKFSAKGSQKGSKIGRSATTNAEDESFLETSTLASKSTTRKLAGGSIEKLNAGIRTRTTSMRSVGSTNAVSQNQAPELPVKVSELEPLNKTTTS